jgi:hypothetical protein
VSLLARSLVRAVHPSESAECARTAFDHAYAPCLYISLDMLYRDRANQHVCGLLGTSLALINLTSSVGITDTYSEHDVAADYSSEDEQAWEMLERAR